MIPTILRSSPCRAQVHEIPFNSTNKWALVIVEKEHANGVLQSYIKGAPERVLAKCTHFLQDNKIWQITDEFKALYDEAYSVSIIYPSLIAS